jgi:hypothetical protein
MTNSNMTAYTLYSATIYRTTEGVWVDQSGTQLPDQCFASYYAKPVSRKARPVVRMLDTFVSDASVRIDWVVAALSLDILSEELAEAMEVIIQTYKDAQADALDRATECWVKEDGLLCDQPAFKAFRMLGRLSAEAEWVCDKAWVGVTVPRMVTHRVIG